MSELKKIEGIARSSGAIPGDTVSKGAHPGRPLTGHLVEARLATEELLMLIQVTVPYASQADTLSAYEGALAGKIKVGTVRLPSAGSAALEARNQLSGGVALVSAFQNVAAEKLMGRDPIDCDVIVCGNDNAVCATTIRLAEAAGLRGIHAGPLANSAGTEALTSLLITINRRFKIRSAGVRITGIPA